MIVWKSPRPWLRRGADPGLEIAVPESRYALDSPFYYFRVIDCDAYDLFGITRDVQIGSIPVDGECSVT
jgi:hypothetical protein